MLFIESTYKFENFYNFYLNFVAESFIYIRNFILYISFWLVGYLLVCCVVYRRYARKLPTRTRGALGAKRVLLVIAHPDDECMFFGPTIFRLCEQGAEVYLLCLSNGNYDGKGNERKNELWEACRVLGVPDSNIYLIMDTRLQDNPKSQWPVPVIAKLVQHQLEALDIDTLVTFDRGGISSHPNHAAVFYAVAYMFVEKNMPQKCTVYTLDSVNILRKYLSFLDLPLSFVLSSKRLCNPKGDAVTHWIRAIYLSRVINYYQMLCDNWDRHLDVLSEARSEDPHGQTPRPRYFLRWTESRRVTRAMKKHKSQMVWFRYLYIMYSRYMVINTLRKINLADIELELEVDD